MTAFEALLDSNVLVASVVITHEHREPSAELLLGGRPRRFAFAAHSMAEAFVTLTRAGGGAPFQIAPSDALALLDSVRAVTGLVGMTPPQLVEAVRQYATRGGIGPRLYDALIGATAVAHAIPAIITWNTRHLSGLFPDRQVVTPAGFLAARR